LALEPLASPVAPRCSVDHGPIVPLAATSAWANDPLHDPRLLGRLLPIGEERHVNEVHVTAVRRDRDGGEVRPIADLFRSITNLPPVP
jgi:hypothetical protein